MAKDPNRVFPQLNSRCEAKAKKVTELLEEFQDCDKIDDDEATQLKDSIAELRNQYKRMETEWETFITADSITNEDIRKNCQQLVENQDDNISKLEKNARHLIKTKLNKATPPKQAVQATQSEMAMETR